MAFAFPALEALGLGGAEAAGAAGGAGAVGGFMGEHPFLMGNLMGHAMAGGGPAGQMMMGPSPDASVAEPMVGVTGRVSADMFDEEDEVGMATKNRGDNSDPDQQSSSGADTEERGDGPEQLKDVGGGALDAHPADNLIQEGGADEDLRQTATNAFHSNLPLVLEFAFSDQSGADHPILKALDELLESAFPGYKDIDPMLADMDQEGGEDVHDPENPTEKLEGEIGQDLDNDGPADTPENEDESRKARVATLGVDQCERCYNFRDKLIPTPLKDGRVENWCQGCRGPLPSGSPAATHPSGHQFGQDIGGSDANYSQPYMPRSAAEKIAVDAGYCPGCWGVLDLLGRCQDCGKRTIPGHSPYHTPDRYPTQDRPVFKQADVPGPPAATGMGYATDTGAATNITGIPTCPLCHQNHVAGTPCPTPQQQAPVAMPQQSPASSNFGVPMQPNKVVTKYRVVAMSFGICPSCGKEDLVGHSGYGEWSNRDIMECGHCGYGWDAADPQGTLVEHPSLLLDRDEAKAFHDKYAGDDAEFDPEGRYSKTAEYNDDEIDREPDPMHNESYEDGETPDIGWYEDWEGPDKDQDKHPWTDDSGKPLEEGQEYDMHSTGYAVPDKIKVLSVTPNKLTYELEAGDLAYKDTITTDDVYKQGYTFQPSTGDDDPGMETQPPQRQPLELAHPKPPRPGDDALPQQDDIASPPTRVSHEETNDYYGSFRGDDPDSRNWLNDPGPGQGVDIDPVTMAKIAGKDFSAREQRQFIDENGTARNLHRLNLEGTHYELDDYGDSLW